VPANPRVSYFVSAHGYGHATRAAAVINALQEIVPDAEVQVLTKAPRILFDETVARSISYLENEADLGIAQKTPLREDLVKTLRNIKAFLPFDGKRIHHLTDCLREFGTDVVVCDIAPIGIVAAKLAGVPSVLVENFTWDWIFEGFAEAKPEFRVHVSYLDTIFSAADFRIRATPACTNRSGDLIVRPIGRRAVRAPSDIRRALGIEPPAKMVLVTLGGTEYEWSPKRELMDYPNVVFVVPSFCKAVTRVDNTIRLPFDSEFYHPDLVNAADVVIAKLGYSTVAEVYYAGVPIGYVPRPTFRESAALERFVHSNMPSLPIGMDVFERHGWASQLSRLLGFERSGKASGDGARAVAEFIREIS